MPAVSVIIPTYNTNNYILKTLQALKDQTFKDIEVIIVNDGSTDNTKEIVLNNLSDAPFPWMIIDQENQGASAARNKGLEVAKGEYVYFLDSDDYIHKTFIEKMYNTAKNRDYDIIISGFMVVAPDGKILKKFENKCNSTMPISGKTALKLRLRRDIRIIVDNVIYKKELLTTNHIKFDPTVRQFAGDVLEFSFKAFYSATRVGCISEALVFYTRRPNSASTQHTKDNLSGHFNNLLKTYRAIRTYIKDNETDHELLALLDEYIGFRLTKILFFLYSIGEYSSAEEYKKEVMPLIQKSSTRNIMEKFLKFLVIYYPKLCRPAYLMYNHLTNLKHFGEEIHDKIQLYKISS
ncbi:hypothetical protein EP1X_01290 [Thermococcus sp. EP1]|uniref:glycosyltransferase n=1 Tax=Thermococcus sp. EP1 TaxID=1591054 RepID=UPI0006D9824F|nr:glycosyltransferase [Thermococcus sp. EP1]KPU63860.1 hypothetical protein EP1X_01290 [Thermococcus sp. EP1]